MQFNSYLYIFVFLPGVFALYAIFRTRPAAKVILLIASNLFYGFFAPLFLIPLWISAVMDYCIGRRLGNGGKTKRRRFLVLSCVLNLGLLSVFKYGDWIVSLVAQVTGNDWQTDLPLPPGISFYTFQTLCYVFAVYQMQYAPTKNFTDYMNYVMFFPQLVAGPIERAQRLLPQLEKVRPMISLQTASSAVFLILFGLFKKLVLADNFGLVVEFAEGQINASGGAGAPGMGILFAMGFGGQIYCDFSAYSDIAIGSAALFGVQLMTNFRQPYFAANPAQFWGGWHISLTTWLREYLFIPLSFWFAGKGRKGRPVHALLALFCTMFLCGLWHGAGFLFILWGLYHACLYVIYAKFPIDRYLKTYLGTAGTVLATVIFFCLICFSWVLFRATSFAQAGEVLSSVAHSWELIQDLDWIFYKMAWWFSLLFVTLLLWDLAEKWGKTDIRGFFQKLPPVAASAAIVFLFYAIVFFGRREANEFIYFAF